MGKLAISQELSDKISNSLRIKQTDTVDGRANKPIIRNGEPPKKDSPPRQLSPKQPSPRDSPIKKRHEYPKQPSPKNSPIKKRHEYPKQPSPINSPIKKRHEYQKQPSPIKNTPMSRPNKANKLNYFKISKIVFISSIVGGIGITLGIKLGIILFL
jgi:hypothetical protein